MKSSAAACWKDSGASPASCPEEETEWLGWFDELADLSSAERAARLDRLAGERPELAGRLARLFAAEDAAAEAAAEGTAPLLARPVAERAPELMAAALHASDDPGGPGGEIGPYRLLELMGRGGMGEVYRAERADGVFEQQVALKLVRRGMDSEEIVRRFHRERQILARLAHPGIARILDGGTAPDGRPYFVLELVDGEPILAHCRRRGSSLEERLRLVIDTCDAVDSAHRDLVVHRDLKPSNLLVSTEGQVKLLDFGIAKLLADETPEMVTRQEDKVLTPAYAAPEQILGEPVTTATDVYALGVILYELLAGRSPHPRRRSPHLVAREGDTVERPSAALLRHENAREEEPGKGAGIADRRRFARRVRGELDTIVLAALRRDPARRYRSAADLAADLRRFLEGWPLQVRPDSLLYRTRKLVLRHKLATMALAAAVAGLVGGLGVAVREAEIARAEARRAEQVKELLVSIFRQADPETGQGPDLTAGEILAAGTQRVETELAREPRIQAELLDAIAQIQGSLGQFDPAVGTAAASFARRRALFGAESVPVAQSLITQAELAAKRGLLEEAFRLAEQARPALERHAAPESPDRQRLTRVRIFLLRHQGEPEQALALVEELLEANRRRFGPASVETARLLLNRAEVLGDLSRFAEAERAVRQALAILEPSPQVARLEVSYARRSLADLLESLNRNQEAAAQFDAVLALHRATLGPRHPQVAFTRIAQGFLLSEMRRFPEAEAALLEAIRILEPLDHFEMGAARRYLGLCLMNQERYAEAERQFTEAERFLRTKLEADHPLVWGSRISQGIAQLRLGRLGDARRTLSEVVDHFARTGPEGDANRTALKHLGEVAWREGSIDEALALHRQARQIEVKIFRTEKHVGVAFSDYLIALDLLALGAPGSLAEARQRIDAALAVLRHEDAGHPTLNRFLLASGRIALAAGDGARARQDLTEAVARLRGHRGGDHPDTREAEALLRRVS